MAAADNDDIEFAHERRVSRAAVPGQNRRVFHVEHSRSHGLRAEYQKQAEPGQIHSGVFSAMLRSDWNILAPLAGLAALFTAFALGAYVTALDNPEQGYPRYSAAREQGEQANTAGSVNLAYPVHYRTPCANPQRESESDLCAQWRAANAAEESALWTKLGFWAGLFGLAGLYWQVILTRRAVEDTGLATKAMYDSNEIMRADQRAWLKADLAFEFASVTGPDGWTISLEMKIENIGRTPASNVTWGTDIYDDLGRSMKWIDMMVSNEEAWETPPKIYHTPITIMPGESFEDQELVFVNGNEIPTLRMGPTSARLFLTTDYDGGHSVKGRTITSFIMGPQGRKESWPDAFDLEKRAQQTDILIRRLGTVLAR